MEHQKSTPPTIWISPILLYKEITGEKYADDK